MCLATVPVPAHLANSSPISPCLETQETCPGEPLQAFLTEPQDRGFFVHTNQQLCLEDLHLTTGVTGLHQSGAKLSSSTNFPPGTKQSPQFPEGRCCQQHCAVQPWRWLAMRNLFLDYQHTLPAARAALAKLLVSSILQGVSKHSKSFIHP